jgi:flagellar motor switch protein FliN/FliY
MDRESVAGGNKSVEPPNDIVDGAAPATSNLELLRDVELPVTLRFGSAQMSLRDLARLETGGVIKLDRALTDPVEVLVGGTVIARGEPIVVQGVYGIRISEIASRHERLMTTSLHATVSGENLS